ncbi:MAG: cupredoxin domain-containing protein [Acidimicrobiales bacterium]
MTRLRLPLAGLLALLMLTGVACGEKNEIGSGVVVDGDGGSGDGAIRDSTTTTPTTAAPQETTVTTASKPPPTTKQTAPPTTQQSVALTIKIANRSQYDPSVGGIRVGQLVEWVNNDSIARRIVASDGAFSSPPIAPGATFQWKANVAGEHNYSDPDVPFGVGKLVVQ